MSRIRNAVSDGVGWPSSCFLPLPFFLPPDTHPPEALKRKSGKSALESSSSWTTGSSDAWIMSAWSFTVPSRPKSSWASTGGLGR